MGFYGINSPCGGDFCHLVSTFANSFDPDQGRKNLDPNPLTLILYSWADPGGGGGGGDRLAIPVRIP